MRIILLKEDDDFEEYYITLKPFREEKLSIQGERQVGVFHFDPTSEK